MKIRKFINKNAILLFLLPSLAGFAVFYLLPFISALKYALYDSPINGSFAGLANFKELFGNSSFRRAVVNTLRFIALAAPLSLILPLVSALLLKACAAGRGALRLAFLIPMVVPTASVAFFWQIELSANGELNYFLSLFNLGPFDFLGSPLAMAAVLLVYIWKNLGYSLVIFLASLNQIPQYYYEAADLEGAGRIRQFFIVTMPALTPTLFFAFVMAIINCFKIFRELYLLAGQHPHESIYMLQHFMNNMFSNLSYQRLTASAYILTAVIAALILLLFFGGGVKSFEKE